jgi:hypothetical protein
VKFLAFIPGIALILLVLWDAFETIVLPRRVTRKYRLTRLFYRYTWKIWGAVVRICVKGRRQKTYLGYYGPLSLILLLSIWAAGMIVGFALVGWSTEFSIRTPEGTSDFAGYLYFSGTTFFTLGLGDVTPITTSERALTVVESGLGLGLLALVIGYLPQLNQSFSRREVNISLLDARAGSPPTASQMLVRHCPGNATETLFHHLSEWEHWAAEVLESHLSYPVLAYFRSQHDNQSWIAALTVILDTCALVITGMEGLCVQQARLTFAITRHAIVDLSLVFNQPPHRGGKDRLPPDELDRLRSVLAEAGIELKKGDEVGQQLVELRRMYEPYLYSMSHYFRLVVPSWLPESPRSDNWQTTAWERGVRTTRREGKDEGEHF